MAFRLFEANQKIKNELAERKRAEEALKTSEEKYKIIVEDTRALLFNVDKKGRFTYINETAASTVGYRKEELIGRFYLKFVHPQDRKHIHEAFSKQLNGDMQDSSVEFRYIKTDGTFGWLSFLTNQIYKDKQVIGLTGVAQDITVRKQMENELRENEERYRSIVENLNQAYYEADRRGVFTYCNPGLLLISGYSEKELLGTISFNLVAEENRKEIVASYKRSLEEKETNITTEFKVQTKNGQKFWVEQATHFEFDENGAFINATNIIRDIDERKRVENELKSNENKLKSIFKVAPIGIGVTSNRVLIELNEYIYKMLGYSSEELIGQSARILYPTQEEFEFVGKEKYRQIEQFGTGSVETKWKCKDGRIIDVLLSSTPLSLKEISGGVTFTALDITQRKQTEELIKESEANLNSMINNRFESIWSIDKNYNYIIFNNFFKEAYLKTYGIELKKGMNALKILTTGVNRILET